jgi:hypothetical protein
VGPPEAPSERFETYDANDRYVVVRDEAGYGVWRVGDLADGEPLERYPDDDAGYEAAAARWRALSIGGRWTRALSILKWVVIGSAAIWGLSAIAVGVLFMSFSEDFDDTGSIDELFQYAQLVEQAAQAITVGALAVSVVVWLDERRRMHPVSGGNGSG